MQDKVKNFSSNSTGLRVTVEAAIEATISLVNFTLNDGTIIPNITSVVDAVDANLFHFDSSGDFEDGIYNAELVFTNGDKEVFGIGRPVYGTTCLAHSALADTYDTDLMLDLEAIELYLLNNEPDLAREIYLKVLEGCRECATDKVPILIGIGISIFDYKFIIT